MTEAVAEKTQETESSSVPVLQKEGIEFRKVQDMI